MTTRVRGGTAGILAALDCGRLDPLNAWLPEDEKMPPMSGADRRALDRRNRRRLRRLAKRLPF